METPIAIVSVPGSSARDRSAALKPYSIYGVMKFKSSKKDASQEIGICSQLRCGQLLHDVSRLRVKDVEECFFREAWDFLPHSVNVINRVAFGKLKIRLKRS